MNFNLKEALSQLVEGAVFKVANEARPGNLYLFDSLLPEIRRNDYQAASGSMTVRATMAGLVGMDSPYPEGGTFEISTFSEETAKLAIAVRLPEKALRDLHTLLQQTLNQDGRAAANETAAQEALNFVNKLLVQPQLDAMEWLRGQALVTGAIDWTFNKKRLLVDYGIPAKYFLTPRTGANGYGGTTSKFWTDIREAKALLKSVRAFIVHPDTKEMILANSANNIQIIAETETSIDVVRIVGTTERTSTDPRDRVRLVTYGLEGEVLDPDNPGKTLQLPFMARGALLAVGNNLTRSFVVGAGSTPPPDNALGYTHLAPTIEGNNRPGRWARVFTPEGRPWALEGESVANGLPVIEATDKIVVGSTEMV
jgi:hypothetical protein